MAVQRNGSVVRNAGLAAPTTTEPSADVATAPLENCPPGRSPRPIIPARAVQRNASSPLDDALLPTTVAPSAETPAAAPETAAVEEKAEAAETDEAAPETTPVEEKPIAKGADAAPETAPVEEKPAAKGTEAAPDAAEEKPAEVPKDSDPKGKPPADESKTS